MYARTLPRLHHPLRQRACESADGRHPQPLPRAGRRVRLTAGTLKGLTGQVLASTDPERWLIEIDGCNLLVRVHPDVLELLPK